MNSPAVEMAGGWKGEADLEIVPTEKTFGLRMRAGFRFDWIITFKIEKVRLWTCLAFP